MKEDHVIILLGRSRVGDALFLVSGMTSILVESGLTELIARDVRTVGRADPLARPGQC